MYARNGGGIAVLQRWLLILYSFQKEDNRAATDTVFKKRWIGIWEKIRSEHVQT